MEYPDDVAKAKTFSLTLDESTERNNLKGRTQPCN